MNIIDSLITSFSVMLGFIIRDIYDILKRKIRDRINKKIEVKK